MNELQEIIGKLLIAFGQSILEQGLPKEPFIIQGEPGKEYGYFIAIWPNTGDRAEDVVHLRRKRA